jgi:hypothetical protein
MMSDMDLRMMERGYKKGGDVESVPVKDIKSGKVKQSTDEDFYGKAKDMPMPTRRPAAMKKGGMKHDDAAQDKAMIKSMIKPSALKKAGGGMAQKVQMAKLNAVEASLKGQKKTGYADGGLSSLGGRPSPAAEMGKQYTPAEGSALQSMAGKGGTPLGMADPSQLASINKMMGSAGAPPDAQQQLAAFKAGRAAQNMPKGGTPLGMADPSQQAAIGRMMSSPNQPKINPANAGKSGLNGGLARSMAARPNPAASVPVASRSPLYGPAQAGMPSAPAGLRSAPQSSRGMKNGGMAESAGGARIGVGQSRPNKPNVGALRAAMAKKASMAMPENAPGMMKKGGKVGC